MNTAHPIIIALAIITSGVIARTRPSPAPATPAATPAPIVKPIKARSIDELGPTPKPSTQMGRILAALQANHEANLAFHNEDYWRASKYSDDVAILLQDCLVEESHHH